MCPSRFSYFRTPKEPSPQLGGLPTDPAVLRRSPARGALAPRTGSEKYTTSSRAPHGLDHRDLLVRLARRRGLRTRRRRLVGFTEEPLCDRFRLGSPDKKYWPCKSNSVRLGSSPRAPKRVGGLRAVGRGSGHRASHDSLLLCEWRRRPPRSPVLELPQPNRSRQPWH